MLKGTAVRLLHILVFVAIALSVGSVQADNLKKKVDSGSVATDGSPVKNIGDVDIGGGLIRKTYDLYNGSSEDLILKGAFTSCACTKAFIELPNGTVSEPFGMSLPRRWYHSIKPGQRFKVHLQFDPAYHGSEGVGPFHRSAYLVTSAPSDDNVSSRLPLIKYGTVSTLTLSGTVLTTGEYASRHPSPELAYRSGEFLFPSRDHDLGVVKQSEGIVSYQLPFRYEGKKAVTVTGTPASCACVSASISKENLKPGDEGTLTVRFDPNYHKEPDGKFFKDVLILTDPAGAPETSFRIWAEVDLDLGPEAYKFKEHDDGGDHTEEEEGH